MAGPLARVPVSGEDHIANHYKKPKFRLLRETLQQLQLLRVKLTLAAGREPVALSSNGFDLALEILSVSPEQKVPAWVQQRFAF